MKTKPSKRNLLGILFDLLLIVGQFSLLCVIALHLSQGNYEGAIAWSLMVLVLLKMDE